MLTPRMIERINRYLLTQDDIDQGIIWKADFENDFPLTGGANTREIIGRLARANMLFTRASDATVQTSASTLVSSGIGVDGPRVGSNGSVKGLVIEEARTSQILRATELTTAPWVKQLGTETWVANAATAPDGNATAESVITAASAAGGIAQTWASYAAGTYTVSVWAQAQSGSKQFNFRAPNVIGVSNQVLAAQTCGTSWARKSSAAVVTGATGGGSTVIMNVGAGAYALNLWGAQLEAGAFPTELILTTGAAATRATDRLKLAQASQMMRGGRVGLEMRFVPKGARTDYGTPQMWFAAGTVGGNGTNINANGTLTTYAEGAAYSTSGAIAWNAGETVDLWIEAGGGSLVTVVKYRRNNGTPITLGTSSAPQARMLPTGLADLLGYIGSSTYALSAWLKRLCAYDATRYRPQWAY